MKYALGVAALALAMIAFFIPHNGLYLTLSALAVASAAAFFGEKPFAATTPLVAATNLFFLNPAMLDAINKSRDVLMMWVLLIVCLVLPFVAMALNSSGAFDFSERKGHH